MASVALPQCWIAPVIPGHAAAALRGAAGAIELVVGRAVAHGVVDSDLIARLDRVHGDDGDLPVEAGIRLAAVIDVIRRLVGRERGEVESLLDLRRVVPDVVG